MNFRFDKTSQYFITRLNCREQTGVTITMQTKISRKKIDFIPIIIVLLEKEMIIHDK